MTDQLPKPTGLSKPTVPSGDDDFFNQDFSRYGMPERDLEIGGKDIAVGLAGSSMKALGTGIAETSLGDLARGARGIADGTLAKGIADSVAEKVNPDGAGLLDGMASFSPEIQDAQKSDPVDGVASTVGNAIGDAAEWVGDKADKVITPATKTIGSALKSGGESVIKNGTSADYQEAVGRELYTGNSLSTLKLGSSAGDAAVWAAKMVDGIGSISGTVAAGALTGGTVSSLVKRQMLKRGAGEALASETARLAGIKWGQRGAVAAGVNMSTGQAADQARAQVNALSWDQLTQSQTFMDQARQIAADPEFAGKSSTEILDEAKRRTGDHAASIAMSDPKTWAAAAAGTVLGDANLFKMLQGVGAKGAIKGLVQGAAGEATGEAIEEGTQQYVGNEATNKAGGQQIDPWDGVAKAAATAGTIGALTGGVTGSIGGARGEYAPQEDGSSSAGQQQDQSARAENAEAWDRGLPSKHRKEYSNVPPDVSDIPDLQTARKQMAGESMPGAFALATDQGNYRGVYVDSNGKLSETALYATREDALTAMRQNPTFWTDEQRQENAAKNAQEIEALRAKKRNGQSWDSGSPSSKPEGYGSSQPIQAQGQDAMDTPSFVRQDGGRFKGWAEDSEVQRALAGDFGPSVAELVKRQVEQGDQGPTPQEKPIVDAMNAPLGLPHKDVIFAGDANAKQPGTEVAAPGAFDDKQAGPGPQFRGAERTRWQDGQEGDVLPPEVGGNPAGALPGRVIEGEAREVGTELPYRDVVYGQDGRPDQQATAARDQAVAAQNEQLKSAPPAIGQSDTIFAAGAPGADNKNNAYTPPRLSRDQIDTSLGEQSIRDPRTDAGQAIQKAGSEADAIFGQLKSLRITKRGKPFSSLKEAQLASRKTETPIELPTGGFGVVEKAELEAVQANQPTDVATDPVSQEISQEPTAPVINEGTKPPEADNAAMPQQLPETEPVQQQTRESSMPPTDGMAPEQNTAPAPDAGVSVSGPQRFTIEPLTDKSIIVKGDKNDAELKEKVEAAWPKAKPLYNERHKGWVFSSKREGVVREALADLGRSDVGKLIAASAEKAPPKESLTADQNKPPITNKLRDTGNTLIIMGADKERAPRLTNTPKRAGQAASAIKDAQKMQADGETLIKIADAVDAGAAPHLAKMSSKVQYQTLDKLHRIAIPNQHMEGGEHRGYYEGRTEQRRKSGITVDDYADKIKYPTISAHPDHLRTAAKILGEVRGYKGLAEKLHYAARLVTNADRYQPAVLNEETAKALIKAAKDTGNREVKWAAENVESGLVTIDRLRRMGIDNRDQLVEAIKELDAIQVPRKQESRLQQLERGLVGNKIPGYFNTQGEALDLVMAAADIKPGDTVLEPSAGKGNIADAAKDAGAEVDTVERHYTLREILQEKGHNLVGDDFTALNASKQYDKVIMNPPFEQQQDIEHVRKAWDHIKPGGRLVAVMSAGVESNSNRKATEFRQWLDDNGGSIERLPEGSFKDSDRSTGVNTVMVVMDKPLEVTTDGKGTAEKQTAALFSKSKPGLSVDVAERVADDFMREFKGRVPIKVRVAQTQEELYGPGTSKEDIGYGIEGSYSPKRGVIGLVSGVLRDAGAARRVLRHEVLGHYGLDTFSPEDKKALLQKLIDAKDETWIAPIWKQIEGDSVYGAKSKLHQAEEVFAHIAEREPQSFGARVWSDIKATISQLLRKVGLISGPIKEHELDNLIRSIAKGIRSGKRTKKNFRDDQDVIGNDNNDVVFSLSGSNTNTPGMTAHDIEQVANEWVNQYKGAAGVRVMVANNQDEIAEVMDMAGEAMPAEGDIVEAVYLPRFNALLLNSAEIHSPDRVRELMRHEVLAHHGLRKVVGDDLYLTILNAVKHGGEIKSIKEAYYRVAQNYAGAHGDMQAEEVFAHWAENQPERGDLYLWWRGVLRTVKDALRKVGLLGPKTTEDEFNRVLDAIVIGMRNGRKPGRQVLESWHEVPAYSLNGDPLYSKKASDLLEQAKQVAQESPSSMINALKQKRPVALGALTDLQIDQIFKNVTGGAISQYQKLRTKMEADRNEILLNAETKVDPLWDELGKEQQAVLSSLMHDATMTKLHPDLSLDDNSLYQEAKERLDKAIKPETKARYQDELNTIRDNWKDLNQRYQLALDPKSRALYQTMKGVYDTQWSELRDAIEQRLEDLMGAEGKTIAAELRLQMERALQHGPYFPLARFGDYVVKARKGDEYLREHFERRKDAERAVQQYQRDGYQAVMTVKEEGKGDAANTHSLGLQILSKLDEAAAKGSAPTAIKDDVWQAMLQMLPDASYAKHAIHRRRVKGASRDGHRAYLNSVYHFAHHVSKIRYGHKMQAELDGMNQQIQAGVNGEQSTIQPEDLEVAQQVLNEMNKRHDLNMNPKGKAWAGWLGNLGFVWYMAGSPASALINMTQNFTVMLPQLGAKYGFAKAALHLGKALKDYIRLGAFKPGTKEAWVSLTRSNKLPADERQMLETLYKAGALDLTQAHSIAARADTDLQDVKPGAVWQRKTVAIMGSMFHNAEVLNREVAALAAYRLLKEKSPNLSPEQYADKVTEMVYNGHGNYAASNRPRYMRGDAVKVLTQFKIYSQLMTYTLYRNAYLACKGDRVALKTLGGLMGTHFIMAGVMGLPFPVTAALYGIASAFDDDDDRTGEASFRLGLSEVLGKDLGELVAKGPMDYLTGLSIAGRTGINELWYKEPKEGTEGDDLAWHVTQQIAGPVLGIGVQAARGLSMMGDGDYERGAETMMPKAVKDLMKTYRQASEGERTRKGDVIIDDVSAWNLAAQAMGFSSAAMAKAYDAREYIKGKEEHIESDRSRLLSDYIQARKNGDSDEMENVLQRIREFNATHYRTEVITGKTIRQSLMSKRRSGSRTQDGTYLSKKREYLRKEGDFAF